MLSRPEPTGRLAHFRHIPESAGRLEMTLSTVLIIILILLLIGAIPNWGYSRGWGYFPSGGIGLVLLIVIILVLLGRI
jgi:hypothetical protein